MAKPDVSQYQSFDQISRRLDDIVGAVRDRDVSLERSLDLFDEAIALGSKAVELVDATDFSPEEKAMLADDGTPGDLHFRRQAGHHELTIDDGLDSFWPHQDLFCTCWAKLFSTRALRDHQMRFDPALRHAQDTLFTLTYLLTARPTVAIDYDAEVYCYRQNPASCVHAIPLEKRLASLELLVDGLDRLAQDVHQPRRLAAPKAAEYLWALRKFSANAAERDARLRQLLDTPLYREHLAPGLRQFGKAKHRLILRLIDAGLTRALRFW